MANRRTLTDADWNRIWREKFEDPNYYRVHSTCITTSSILDRMSRGENAFMCARRRKAHGDYTGDVE